MASTGALLRRRLEWGRALTGGDAREGGGSRAAHDSEVA